MRSDICARKVVLRTHRRLKDGWEGCWVLYLFGGFFPCLGPMRSMRGNKEGKPGVILSGRDVLSGEGGSAGRES